MPVSLLSILTKRGHGIPDAVEDADDDKCGFRYAVVDDIISINERSQARQDGVAAWSKLRVMSQGFEILLDLPDEAGCPLWRVFGDERPDFGKIVLGLIGYAEDERAEDFAFPFLMIRSASKSRTRSASISSIPA